MSEQPRRLFVGIGNGAYDEQHGLRPLPNAVSDVETVRSILVGEPFTVDAPPVVANVPSEEIREQLKEVLPPRVLEGTGTSLVVLWAGHGVPGTTEGSLRLLLVDNGKDDGDVDTLTVDQLTERAVLTGAKQILLIIDTCRSSAADLQMLRIADSVLKKLADRRANWVGVVASSRDHERAVDGALGARLAKLLRDGPDDQVLRLRWSSYQAGLRRLPGSP